MKRILSLTSIIAFFTVFTLSLSLDVNAQTTIDIFCERFESTPWEMRTYGLPASSVNGFEQTDQVTFGASMFAATDTIVDNGVNVRSRSYIETPNLEIFGYTFIGVQFSHIAYLGIEDQMRFQVSFDKGNNWITVGNVINSERTHTGSQSNILPGNFFNSLSRINDWGVSPPNDSIIWTNANAAWSEETFNITPIIAQQNPAPDSAMFRIELRDVGVTGRNGLHRYYLDDFCVRGSNCEQVPPTVNLDPPSNYPSRYVDRVYLQGPYNFNAFLADASSIDTAYVHYIVKRDTSTGTNPPAWATIIDSSKELVRVGNTSYYNANINPSDIPGNAFLVQDSVFWRVIVEDGSPCRNLNSDPAPIDPMEAFEVRGSLPLSCQTQPIYSFPYIQEFDDASWVVGESPDGLISDEWYNGEGDFHNWWVNQGPTLTPGTGPSNSFPTGGKYLYVEASDHGDQTAFLLTPCVDLLEVPNGLIRFYLNQNTQEGGVVHVDLYDASPRPGFPNGRFINDVIPPIAGNKGDNWLPYEFTTYQVRNQVTQVRFRTTPSLLDERSDVALDSFKIVSSPLDDIRCNRVILPPYSPEDEPVNITVEVQNIGVSDVTNLNFFYEVYLEGNEATILDSNTDLPNGTPWTGVIGPSEVVNITIPNETYDVPLGRYIVKAWAVAPVDEVRPNDTTLSASQGIPYKQIYFEDTFEPNVSNFTNLSTGDTIQNNWEIGTPNYDVTNSAFTKPNAWDILLDRPYSTTGRTVSLMTPFLDFSAAEDVFISFFNNRDMNEQRDGVYLQYSMDQGFTWDSIPTLGDPERLKWYNSNLSGTFGGQPVFSGRTRQMGYNWNNWLESELMLPDTFNNEPLVLFRFNFFAQDINRAGNDGMSIDNFLVYDRKPIDVEPQYFFGKEYDCNITSTERFKACFKNRGETVINGFDVQYVVTNTSTNAPPQIKTETVNRTINPRDTIYHRSQSTFDLSQIGYYEVKIITQLNGDGYPINDTITKIIENIDGCQLTFEAIMNNEYKTQARTDSSVWRFSYEWEGVDYEVSDNYVPFNPQDTHRIPVCIKANSFVQFSLGDQDTAIQSYSLYGFDGAKDVIFVNQASGGSDAPTQYFEWDCPPQRTAVPLELRIDDDVRQLPFAKNYSFKTLYENDGLDSIVELELGLWIDGNVYRKTVTHSPPLEYREVNIDSLGSYFLGVGRHEIRTWTRLPNGSPDQVQVGDTITRIFTVIDTTETKRCFTFEDEEDDTLKWLSLNFENYAQDNTVSFERATPSAGGITGANNGTKSWVTDADSSYKTFDYSALISPFFELERDSCYLINFYHHYVFTDTTHDGANLMMTLDDGENWEVLNYKQIGVGDTLIQKGWYNEEQLVAMPDNEPGWTGRNGGYTQSQTIIPSYTNNYALFAFRFASDGNDDVPGGGWSIDDVCIEMVPDTFSCFAVGLGEREVDPSKFYMGQNIPNPAFNRTRIPYYLPHAGNVQFTVTNMMGQTVYQESSTEAKGNHLMNLNLNGWSNGIYYYWIHFDDVTLTEKMIISR